MVFSLLLSGRCRYGGGFPSSFGVVVLFLCWAKVGLAMVVFLLLSGLTACGGGFFFFRWLLYFTCGFSSLG